MSFNFNTEQFIISLPDGQEYETTDFCFGSRIRGSSNEEHLQSGFEAMLSFMSASVDYEDGDKLFPLFVDAVCAEHRNEIDCLEILLQEQSFIE